MFLFFFFSRPYLKYAQVSDGCFLSCVRLKVFFHSTNQTARHEPEGLEFFEFLSNKD